MKLAALLLSMSLQAANYTAQRVTVDGIEVIRLTDAAHKTQVSIAPTVGLNLYEMKVNGIDVMYFPQSLSAYKAQPSFAGTPFLAPWANRLDHDGFFANGKEYKLNPALNNLRRDGHKQPIHGLVVNSQNWQVVRMEADAKKAVVTSRLEFWKHPDWMAQFPFAHTIEVTHRLQDGILEVDTTVENLSIDSMPLSLGFHPYFAIHDAPRDQWKVTLPVKQHIILSETLVPTGQLNPSPYTAPFSLTGVKLDDVFSGIASNSEFSVEGLKQKIAVRYGPKYPVAVVYAPPGKDFICFEPMTGPTNAFNLHYEGKYSDLQQISPGAKWRESFWIHPTGF